MPKKHLPQPGSGPLPLFVGFIFIGAGFGYGLSYTYQKNYFTNRRQFVFISRRIEKYLGKIMANQFHEQHKSSTNKDKTAEANAYIESLLAHLISHYKTYKKEEWNVNIIQSDVVNACAIPGGHIFVFTGLLKFCKSIDELAFVLSHEISHVEARHSAERFSVLLPFLALVIGISYYISQDYEWLVRFGFTYMIELPQSRFSEYEADKMAVGICKKAGFDAIKGAEFFKRGDKNNLEFVSTHPSHEHRWSKIIEEEKKVSVLPTDSNSQKEIKRISGTFSRISKKLQTTK